MKRFSAAEDDFIRKNYLTKTGSEIGAHLRRSEQSIICRANKIGIRKDLGTRPAMKRFRRIDRILKAYQERRKKGMLMYHQYDKILQLYKLAG